MAAMGNLLVKDDAASPVEYTFKPVTDKDGSPYYRTSIAGVPLEGQMRFRLTEEQLKDGNWKRTAKLEVPVMETLGASGTSAGYVAPPKVAYVETMIFTHFSNRRSTVADRANSLKLAVGILQGASATTATGVLNQASAGQAFTSSILPVPLFYTSGETPS
jgi:hypothetical protein